jgi:hypothetical protein
MHSSQGKITTLVCASLVAGSVGCSIEAVPPGMSPAIAARRGSVIELARVDAAEGRRPLLVVYPETPCTGSASGVVLDADGRFLGAVAPGTGALLSVPADKRPLTVISSVEVTAARGTWYSVDRIRLPPFPAGLVLRPSQWNTRTCGSGQYFDVETASKETLEELLAESAVRWFTPRPAEGQRWLDAYGPRVDEVIGSTAPRDTPQVATRARR